MLGCSSTDTVDKNMKDLGENMMDLRIYHENLGDALVAKNKEYATWFVNDMDSIMLSMSGKFTTHRKLTEPFRNDYRKKMAPYLRDLKKEIEAEEWPKAIKTYTTLTKKCNGCHIDLDVDKQVKDATQ
jgi:hypothetical protein